MPTTGSGTFLDSDFTVNPKTGFSRKALATQRASAPGTPIGTGPDGNLPANIVAPLSLLGSSHAHGVHLAGLANAAFEDGLDGWTPATSGTGTAAVDATATITGVNAVKLACAASADVASITSGLFPCGEMIPFWLGLRGQLVSGASNLSATVSFFDKTKTLLSSGGTVTNPQGTAALVAAYAELGGAVTPPAGTRYASVTVQASGAVGAIRVDEVRVQRMRFAPEVPFTPAATTLTAATGATRTLQSALNEQVRLLDFGPLGGTDDVATWNAAIGWANARGGGVTFVLPDTVQSNLKTAPTPITTYNVYFRGGTINYVDGVQFQWGTNGSTPVAAGYSGFFGTTFNGPSFGTGFLFNMVFAIHMDFRDITFQGVSGLAQIGTTTSGVYAEIIRFTNVQGLCVNCAVPLFNCIQGSGLFVDNFKFEVANVAPPAGNTTSVTTMIRNRDTFYFSGSTWDTAHITNGFMISFYRCLNVYANNGTIQNIFFRNNTCDFLGGGVILQSAAYMTVSSIDIIENYIIAWDDNGITLSGPGAVVGCAIRNNRVQACGKHGVWLDTSTRMTLVTNNLIYGYGRTGSDTDINNKCAGVRVIGAATDFSIRDNMINNPSQTLLGYSNYNAAFGIWIDAGCDGFNVSGNNATGQNLNFYLPLGDALASKRRLVHGNPTADYAGPISSAPFTMPASGTAWTNTTPYRVKVSLRGAFSAIAVDGANVVGATTLDTEIDPGHSFTGSYSGAANSVAAMFSIAA